MLLVFRILLAVPLLMAGVIPASASPGKYPPIPKQVPKTFSVPRCALPLVAVGTAGVAFLAHRHLCDTSPPWEKMPWPVQASSMTVLEQLQSDTLAHTSQPSCGASGCAATVTDFSYCAIRITPVHVGDIHAVNGDSEEQEPVFCCCPDWAGSCVAWQATAPTAFVKTVIPGIFSKEKLYELEKDAYMYGVLEKKKSEHGAPRSFTLPELLAVQDHAEEDSSTGTCGQLPVQFDPVRPKRPTQMLAFTYDPDYVVPLRHFLEGNYNACYYWSGDFSKTCAMQDTKEVAEIWQPRFVKYTEGFKRYLSLELLLRKSYRNTVRGALRDAIEEMRVRYQIDSDFSHHGNMLVASPEVLREGRKPPLRLIDFTDARDIGENKMDTDRAGVMEYMVRGSVLSFERKIVTYESGTDGPASAGSSSGSSSGGGERKADILTITVRLPGVSHGSASEVLVWRPEIERWLRSEAVNPEGGLFSEDGQRIDVDVEDVNSTQIEFRWLWPNGETIEDVKGDRMSNRDKPGVRLQDVHNVPLKWTDKEQFRKTNDFGSSGTCDNLPGFNEVESWFWQLRHAGV